MPSTRYGKAYVTERSSVCLKNESNGVKERGISRKTLPNCGRLLLCDKEFNVMLMAMVKR